MERIDRQQLDRLVSRINKTLNRPEEPSTKDETGRYRANIGNFHISGAYGGVSLEEICTDSGGVNDVFHCGHISKRELYVRLVAFLDGIETGRK